MSLFVFVADTKNMSLKKMKNENKQKMAKTVLLGLLAKIK